jgi:hypothetical protein
MKAIRAKGTKGASIHDIAEATGFTLLYARGKVWSLRDNKKVKVQGKTSNARYIDASLSRAR